MARKRMAVGELVESLRSLASEPITRDRVLERCADAEVDRASLDPYVHFAPDFYTRNLIYRDETFELMAVCWQPGQRTVIHTHNGQLGWMLVERGGLAVINYKWLGCNAADNQNVVGLDCLAGATELDLERREVVEAYPGGPVSTVDKVQTIHQVVVQGREAAVSLHIYSRPVDSCVAFDLQGRRCYRRQLSFFSRYGAVEVETLAPATGGACDDTLQPPGGPGLVPLSSLRPRG